MSKDILKLENIKVKYGDFVAVDGVTMNVKEGLRMTIPDKPNSKNQRYVKV